MCVLYMKSFKSHKLLQTTFHVQVHESSSSSRLVRPVLHNLFLFIYSLVCHYPLSLYFIKGCRRAPFQVVCNGKWLHYCNCTQNVHSSPLYNQHFLSLCDDSYSDSSTQHVWLCWTDCNECMHVTSYSPRVMFCQGLCGTRFTCLCLSSQWPFGQTAQTDVILTQNGRRPLCSMLPWVLLQQWTSLLGLRP